MNLPGKKSLPNTNPRSARKNRKVVFTKTQMNEVADVLVEDQELYQRGMEKCLKQGHLSEPEGRVKRVMRKLSDHAVK